jgi:hypothetical protein
MRRKYYLYVWENIWRDYTDGLVFAIAHDVDEARTCICKKYDLSDNIHDYKYNDIFNREPKQIELNQTYCLGICGGG